MTPILRILIPGIALATLSIGTHFITADYAGDGIYLPATASYAQTITNPIPPLSFSVNPSTPIYPGTRITLHASFPNLPPTGPNITGTVAYIEKSVLIGTATIVNRVADLTLTLDAGVHSIRAHYSGDSAWGPAEFLFTVYVAVPPRHHAAGH